MESQCLDRAADQKPSYGTMEPPVPSQAEEPHTLAVLWVERLGSGLKYTYSLMLLVFSVALVIGTIFTKQTMATGEKGLPPLVAFVVVMLFLLWLAMIEGGQGALVGLQPVDKALYAESHPRAKTNAELAHKGDNMERFIIGRQFLVVFVVFAINMLASSVSGASVFGLPDLVSAIFLSSGLALILVTITIGQLTAQVNAANCMLDFINNYVVLFSIWTSLLIESSGLMHAVYLVQAGFSKLSGTTMPSNEPPRTLLQRVLHWARILFSVAVLAFSFAVTLSALFQGKTSMWKGVPDYVSVIIFFALMAFVGLMEGMQIALFAVVNLPSSELEKYPAANRNYDLTFSGQNLQAFLIGRQICVTLCMFVVARVTSINVDIKADNSRNIFGVSDTLQSFFNTGLLGAIITTTVASLAWRIVASSFPLAFLSNPFVNPVIRLCLILEASGICSVAWVLGRFNKQLVNYQPDEVYLEGENQRHTRNQFTRREKDIDVTISVLKHILSMCLLLFSVVVVVAAILAKQTRVSSHVHPMIVLVCLLGLLLWLALMEGGQGCLVGMQTIDRRLYKTTHPRSAKCASLVHKGDNLDKFIIGRQFLVVLVVFAISVCGSAVVDPVVLGLPSSWTDVFFVSGAALIVMTVIMGQITAQVNSAKCMLDFTNSYLMYLTTWISLAVEFSGILHAVYLVQICFTKITGKRFISKEPPRSRFHKEFFWFRVGLSVCVLGLAIAVTLQALFKGKTTLAKGLVGLLSVVLFLLIMSFVGLLEGLQIAVFSVINHTEEEIAGFPLAKKVYDMVFAGDNLQAFLIGRQTCVMICMFVVARITTVKVDTTDPTTRNIFGIPDTFQHFVNSGLLGAVIVTILGSLSWRIVASSFPLAFLSNPLVNILMRLCLLVEATGVCSSAWLLARLNKRVIGYVVDVAFIGTSEERAAARQNHDVRDGHLVSDLLLKQEDEIKPVDQTKIMDDDVELQLQSSRDE